MLLTPLSIHQKPQELVPASSLNSTQSSANNEARLPLTCVKCHREPQELCDCPVAHPQLSGPLAIIFNGGAAQRLLNAAEDLVRVWSNAVKQQQTKGQRRSKQVRETAAVKMLRSGAQGLQEALGLLSDTAMLCRTGQHWSIRPTCLL
jgi:hypothetical protein